ncbi:heat shock transcription factor, Y-linked-like, partial [Pseudopipra pipra]|uniref:heat shock transcription factor, Y-linked-like n=1 Tax=Pseudopipra pipra TaxID=415032 RepID=UPI003138E4A6
TKVFIHKLSIHGFCKIEGNSPIPASPDKLQALPAADSVFDKVQQSLCKSTRVLSLSYYNPCFKRAYPHLLCKQSAGVKNTAPAALSLDPNLKEGCQRRSPDIQPVVGAASAEENDPFIAPPQRTPKHLHSAPPQLPHHKASIQTGSACTPAHTISLTLPDPAAAAGRGMSKPQAPSLLPQHCSHSPAGVQAAASTPSDTSPHHTPLTSGLALPTFPFGHPHLAALQALLARLLPFWDPWFSTCWLQPLPLQRQGHHTAKLQHTLTALMHLPSKQIFSSCLVPSLQSHSYCLYILRHCLQGDELVFPSPGKSKSPGTGGVLSKTQKKGSTWLIQ